MPVGASHRASAGRSTRNSRSNGNGGLTTIKPEPASPPSARAGPIESSQRRSFGIPVRRSRRATDAILNLEGGCLGLQRSNRSPRHDCRRHQPPPPPPQTLTSGQPWPPCRQSYPGHNDVNRVDIVSNQTGPLQLKKIEAHNRQGLETLSKPRCQKSKKNCGYTGANLNEFSNPNMGLYGGVWVPFPEGGPQAEICFCFFYCGGPQRACPLSETSTGQLPRLPA